jgi:small subunit ribosomal protein S6
MTVLYDLIVLLDLSAPEDRREQALAEIERMLEAGGTVVATSDWGARRLAYEIDHRPEAEYRLYQIEAPGDLLERLRHSLRIMEGVLRFRIIKAKPGAPTPPPPADHAPRHRAEDRDREREGRVAARAAADAQPS